jgi:hypothetical protein
MLGRCANGFGSLALSALLADQAFAAEAAVPAGVAGDPLFPHRPHFPAKAKNVIFLFMDGGPSQVDTFDPKPRLDREHGEKIKMKVPPTQFDNVGNVLKSPWKFHQYGESGIPVSDLFPHVARHVDKLAIVRSMTSEFSEHTNANYFIHSGAGVQGRPSLGSWLTYGLGSECRNLPGFVVLNSGMIPPGGLDCFNSGFLPASYQGSLFGGGEAPVADIRRAEASDRVQQNKLALLRKLDARVVERIGKVDTLESAIGNYELAFRMQTAVPELINLADESKATLELYGIGASATEIFGRQCLIARRLVERGVRFIELLCQSVGHDRWDQHSNLERDCCMIWRRAVCSMKRSSSGRANSDEPPWPRGAMAATTTRSDSRSGWRGAASAAGRSTAPPTTMDTTPSKINSRCTTCTRRSCTCWGSTTSSSRTASAAATFASPTCTAK